MAGQPRLWFDKWVYLDASTGQNTWRLPANELLPFGDARGVLFTVEYAGVGAGAASVELIFERSSAATARSALFEAMNVTPIPLTQARSGFLRAFSVDGTAGDKHPRGVGSVSLENTSATDWAAVRVRVWYAIQD